MKQIQTRPANISRREAATIAALAGVDIRTLYAVLAGRGTARSRRAIRDACATAGRLDLVRDGAP